MKRLTLIAAIIKNVVLLAGTPPSFEQISVRKISNGDLIFAINSIGNAITESTTQFGNIPIDHVGIINFDKTKAISIIEAEPTQGVTITPLSCFLNRNPQCLIADVANADINVSIENALRYISLPYDSLFSDDNNAMYCSELVQKSYVDALGVQIFDTIPMSFRDSHGEILPYWIEFYSRNNQAVPEGKAGTNPTQLSQSPNVTFKGLLIPPSNF